MSGSNPIILCVDTMADKLTRYCYAHRLKYIYQDQSLKASWSFVHCQGAAATKQDVKNELANNPVYITACGHGLRDQLQDKSGQEIFKSTYVNAKEFNDMIVHQLACDTGADLGKVMN